MTADKPPPFVPKLRFPEFRDAPDWEEVSLGTLLVRAPDYGVNAAAVPFSETLPTYIRITDINDDGQFAPYPRVSVDIDAPDEKYLTDGDIVLARTGASVGKSYRYREEDGPLVYAGFLIRVKPNPERLLSQFLAAYLSTWNYWDWVRFTSARSGQPGINATEYASIPLPLPPDRRILAEQKRIADCLTSLDSLIAAEGRKLETLRQHRQGLMQQLFPQPGETVPRLRFPEFRDAVEWSTPRGDTLFDSINNRSAAPGLPVLAITQEHGAIPRDQIDYHVAVTAKSVASYKEVCEGDFIISLRSFQGGIEHSRYHGVCSPAYVILRRKGGGIDHFFRHLFKSERFIQQLTRNIEGIRDGKMITYAQFSEQLMPVPQPPEQQCVTTCLSSLEDVLAAQARKIDALKTHKQGLLQQLFPVWRRNDNH